MNLKRHQKLLVWVCLAALVLWAFAPLRFLLLPVIYFNTYVHELSHALATLVSGGIVEYVHIYGNGSGLTLSMGGSPVLLATSGYVGSAIVGGMLVYFSRTEEGAKRMLWIAAAFIGVGLLLFVRGSVIGVVAGISWALALVAGAALLEDDAAVFAAQFLGVQQCLTSVYAFIALVTISANDLGHSDAKNMEAVTHVPALFWSLIWMLMGLAAIGIGLRASWKNEPY